MTTSRDKILNKLRAARRPFPEAAPRPAEYVPVTGIDDTAPEALLARFKAEAEALNTEVFVVEGDEAATACVLDLLASHGSERISAWHFKHIPVDKLYTAIQAVPEVDYKIDYPRILVDAIERVAEIDRLESAGVGLTGADAAAATTGTLILSTGEGKSRIPTVLPPVHIAVITLDQILPRIEDWLARERAAGGPALNESANVCFISGPSRTADIEKQLVLGVHGPRRVQVVVKR